MFIFDEVFDRPALTASGEELQERLGVIPDHGGVRQVDLQRLPDGGRSSAAAKVMEPAARMFISSTYWSDTIGLRAALHDDPRRPPPRCLRAVVAVRGRVEAGD